MRSRCDKGVYPWQSCPARETICHKCQTKGNYSTLCFSKTAINELTSPAMEYDASYLTTVTTQKPLTTWQVTISTNGSPVSFKINTGAEVPVISKGAVKSLAEKEVQNSTKRLCGQDNKPLSVK